MAEGTGKQSPRIFTDLNGPEIQSDLKRLASQDIREIREDPWQRPKTSSVSVLALDRPDACLILLEWVDVDHPVEDHREKRPASGVAGFLCGDGSLEAELRIWLPHLFEMAQRRDAEIHMLMPLRHTQRNALIELLFG